MKPLVEPVAWTDAVRSKESPERARFLEQHVDLVRQVALRISARLPASVELDDLIHDGVLGLLEAVDAFDPNRGAAFRTYAEARIRGAVLDGLRRKDWRPRSVRQLQRQLHAVLAELHTRHQRAATEEEIATGLGIGIEEYHALLQDINSGPLLSLDVSSEGMEQAVDRQALPHQPLERRELLEALAEEITHLPERERRVLELYYFEDLNMKEVGAVLGVTESRVCQLHAQCAARLRVALDARLHARH